jgi:hypothetical protein
MLRVFHIVCSRHVTTRGTYVTYRQLPLALAAAVASGTFNVPFGAHFLILCVSKPSFVASPPTHRVFTIESLDSGGSQLALDWSGGDRGQWPWTKGSKLSLAASPDFPAPSYVGITAQLRPFSLID